MKLFLLKLGLLALLLGGCGKNAAPLSEDRMAGVLADLHLAEVRATQVRAADTLPLSGEKNMDSLARYYAEVLHHHELDTTRLQEALGWYMAHPIALDSVYQKTIRQLEGRLSAGAPPPAFP